MRALPGLGLLGRVLLVGAELQRGSVLVNIDGDDPAAPWPVEIRAAYYSARAEAWRSLVLACWEAEDMTIRILAVGYQDQSATNRLHLAASAAVHFGGVAVERSLGR